VPVFQSLLRSLRYPPSCHTHDNEQLQSILPTTLR
jgi:hypothetical protein